MNLEEQKPFLTQLAKALAKHMGVNCEVAVHDLTHGPEGTLFAIENGHITGRQVGAGASEIVLEALKHENLAEDHLCYMTRTTDGRVLKSSSVFLRDGSGKALALLGINQDITDIAHAANTLSQFVGIDERKQPEHVDTIFQNVNDLLDQWIEESCGIIGKPVALMNKDDKVRALHYLDEKGAFLIKKSSDKVARFFDISKYTLYNYLGSEPAE